MIEFLAQDTSWRVSEICGLDRADLPVTQGRHALRVTGKGGKTRIVYLHELADTALVDYLHHRDNRSTEVERATTRAAARSQPLLTTHTGNRYQRQALWQLLRRGTRCATSPTPCTRTPLRHFYVTTAVEAGVEMVHVQADVGRSSLDTAEQVYNQAARDPRAQCHRPGGAGAARGTVTVTELGGVPTT